jgi:glycosyltransferase 2 family protein
MSTDGLIETPVTTPPKPRSPRRKLIGRVVRYTFLVAVVIFAVLEIRDQYAAVADDLKKISVASIIFAIVAVLISLWLSMFSWRRVLADLGSPLPVRAASRVYFVGQLGKYLPGSVWPVLAQMELARDFNVPRPRTAAAAIVSIGLGLVGTLVVAGVLLPFAVTSNGWRLLVIAGLLLSLIIASPPVLNRLMAWGLRVLRRPPMDHPLTTRGLLVAGGLAALGWVAQGLAAYAFAISLGGGWTLLPLSVGGYAAALVAVLGGTIGTSGALVVALLLRLTVTIADLGTGAIFAALPKERSVRRANRADDG